MSGAIPSGNAESFSMPLVSWLMNASTKVPSALGVILVTTFFCTGAEVPESEAVSLHLGGRIVCVVRATHPGCAGTCFAVALNLGLSIDTACSVVDDTSLAV